jgi:hypothetical protein
MLMIAGCLLIGCGEPSEDAPANTVSDVTKTTEAQEEYPVAEEPTPAEQPTADETPSTVEDSVEGRLARAVDFSELQLRNGIVYRLNTGELYTAWAKRFFNGSEQVQSLGMIKDGKEDGPFTAWYENGQKMQENSFKANKLDGPYTL